MLRTGKHWASAGLALLAVSMLLLTACGSGSSTSTSNVGKLDPNKKYTVNFWEAFGTGANKTTLASITQSYMQAHPNVTVNLQPYPDYNTLQTKLTAAIAAGNPPAMSQVYEEWATQFQQANALVPLDQFISGANGLSSTDLSDFYPKLLADGQINGKQYMMPFNKSDLVLYYNGALLKKLGISAPPATLADFETDLKTAAAADGSTWGLSYVPDVDFWSVLYRGMGGQGFVSADGKSADFDSAANKQYATQALGELAPLATGAHPAIHVYTSGYAWQDDFASDHALFAISTIASYPFLVTDSKKSADLDVEEAPLPAGTSGQFTVLYGTNVAIYAGVDADTQAAAWDYMKYLTSTSANATFVKGTGYMPIRQSTFNSPDLQSYYAATPPRKVGPQSLAFAFVASTVPAWDKCRNDISTAFVGVMKGTTTAAAGESKMASDCNRDLSQG